MSQAPPAQRRTEKAKPAAKVRTTRRVVNVPLLIGSGVAAVILGGIALGVHQYQSSKTAGTFLQRAGALEAEENWTMAAGYLGRYLQLEPADIDARLRLITAVEKMAGEGSGRDRLISLLYQTVGTLPERMDLRQKLVEQLLERPDYVAAEIEARKLLDAGDDAQKRIAQRAIAISLRARAREEGMVSLREAAEELAKALANDPGDVAIATLTAQLYREHPTEVGPQATAANADAIMDKLVETASQSSEAHLARYQYRRAYGLKNGQVDLDTALKIDAEDPETLLMAAEVDVREGGGERLESAKAKLQKVIELEPTAPRGYLGLSRLYLMMEDPASAIKTLLDGHDRLEDKSLELDYVLSRLLVDQGRFDEGAKIAAEFEGELKRLMPRLSTAGRIKLENMNRLIQAQLAMARKDSGRAAREAKAIIVSMDKAGDQSASMELLDAYALLATAMMQANRADLAAMNWTALAERAPGYRDAGLKAGAANLALGNTEKAISQLEQYAQLSNASPEVLVLLVQARLQEQISRPPAMRDWQAFLDAVAKAKAQLPKRWEWQLAGVSYLAATTKNQEAMLKRLRELEAAFPDDVALCERLIVIYEQMDQPADAQRVLEAYDRLPINIGRKAILRAAYYANDKRIDEALAVLADAATQATPEELRDIESGRVRLLSAVGRIQEAKDLASQLIAASPTDSTLLIPGIEMAIRLGDFATAEKWEGLLQQGSKVDDFDWRYYRARRLMAQFATLNEAQQREFSELMAELQTGRPGWPPLLTLKGQYSEMLGDRRAAVEAYRAAIAGGDRRPHTLELLVRALYMEGQYEEANRYLSQAGSDSNLQGRFESMAIVAAVQGNRIAEAQNLAKQAVERGSKDPLHYVWLANLQLTGGDRPAAEKTFRTALERFPQDARVWNGLFAYFMQTKQPDKARQVLERWTDRVPMSDLEKQLILGQGYETLGDAAAAENYYRAAIELDGTNASARVRLAKILLSSDAFAAREQLEETLKLDPGNAEARQLLAATLAATGSEADWVLAERLLTTSGGEESLQDDRLLAILFARKGKNQTERLDNYERAEKILKARLDRPDAGEKIYDVDRMLLAGIYEQKARLRQDPKLIEAAREVLRPLVDRPDASADHLSFYIQLLMRHLAQSPADKADESVQAARTVFAGDVRTRIDDLERQLNKGPQQNASVVPTALRVRLLTIEGKPEEGRRLIEQLATKQWADAKDDAARAKVYLQAGELCSTAGFHPAAEEWYRKLVEIAPKSYVLVAHSLVRQGKPKEAVEYCLEKGASLPATTQATVLAQILSMETMDPEVDRKARLVIDAALDADRGNVELLMAVAVERVTRNDGDEAAKLFQRVINLQPRNTLALNNLATLFAERPDRLTEAQEYVERAIAVAGRDPALLDTLGTILFRGGKYPEAIAALEEAVAGSPTDPRYYFHLAAAYRGAGRASDAQDTLQTAAELGLDRALLTSGDRELLASLKHDLLTSTTQE